MEFDDAYFRQAVNRHSRIEGEDRCKRSSPHSHARLMIVRARRASRRTTAQRCDHRSLDPHRPARSSLAIVGMNGSVHFCTSALIPSLHAVSPLLSMEYARSPIFIGLSLIFWRVCRTGTPPRKSALG